MSSAGPEGPPEPQRGSVTLAHLELRGIRNLQPTTIEPAARLNLIHGDNGHGKTSLLEAIYLVATSRSFRVARPREARQHGAAELHVRARFLEKRGAFEPISRDQRVTLLGNSTTVRLDDHRPPSLAVFATRSPVVVFHTEELTLASGPAAARRRLLDRAALYISPSGLGAAGDYARALRARQELLRRGGPTGELDAYESIAAQAGATLTRARSAAVARLTERLLPAFADMADRAMQLTVAYAPGGTEDAERACFELAARRGRDAVMPAASFGPHKDDLDLRLGGRLARAVASQGQLRLLTLALKAAETGVIERATGLEPILLLDDVSSELDPTRTRALFDFLGRTSGQIFLTTPHPAAIEPFLPRHVSRQDFRVENGIVTTEKARGNTS